MERPVSRWAIDAVTKAHTRSLGRRDQQLASAVTRRWAPQRGPRSGRRGSPSDHPRAAAQELLCFVRQASRAGDAGVGTYTAAFTALGRTMCLAEMVGLEASMRDAAVPHDIRSLTAILTAHAVKGDVLNATRYFERCVSLTQPFSPHSLEYRNEYTFAAIILAHANNNDTAGALQLYQECCEALRPHQVPLRVINTAARAFGAYSEAWEFVEGECREHRREPNAATYTSLLHVCRVSEDPVGIKAVLDMAKEDGVLLESRDLAEAAAVLCSAGRCDEGLSLCTSLERPYTAAVVPGLLRCFAISGDPALLAPACAAYAEAMSRLSRPTLPAAEALIELYRSHGMQSEAEGVLDSLHRSYRSLPRSLLQKARSPA